MTGAVLRGVPGTEAPWHGHITVSFAPLPSARLLGTLHQMEPGRPLPERKLLDSPSVLATRWSKIRAMRGLEADEAWRWFIGRYRHFVRGILNGMFGRSDVAEAAEHEFWGYIYLSGALQRADEDRRFRAFLSGVVRNFGRSHARKFVRSLGPGGGTEALAGLEQVIPDIQRQQAEQRLWVQNVISNALRTLRDEAETWGIAMARFYGLGFDGTPHDPWPVSRIAAELEVSIQAVYMLLFRGRKRLRQLVEEELREGCEDDESWREEWRLLFEEAKTSFPGSLEDASNPGSRECRE